MSMKQTQTAAPAGSRAHRPCRGASLQALLFWIAGLAIFVAPFLRTPDGTTWVGEDLRRAEFDIPFDEDVAYFEEDYELEIADSITESSERWFGLGSPELHASGLLDLRRVAAGRDAYMLHCSGCHGDSGDGSGPAARFLDPRPRNFRRGIFKFTSTPTLEKPLRPDILRTITQGLSGSAMPDFRLLPEERRHDLVEYVRYLAMRGEFEVLMLEIAYDDEEVPDPDEIAEIIYSRWDPSLLRAVYPNEPETQRDAESVERGRAIFLDASLTQCDSCHGATGKGDGFNAASFEDGWGYPVRPRDFTTGVFRAGSNPEDLWRSIATGINGTPMGAFGGNLTGRQIWDVVHYVTSLTQGENQ